MTKTSSFCVEKSFKKLGLKFTLLIFAILIVTHFVAFSFFPGIRDIPAVNHRCIMSSNAAGGLGNNMFEFATLYALARLYDCRVVLRPQMKQMFQGCFNISMTNDVDLPSHGHWKGHWMANLKADNRFNMTNMGYRILLTGYPSDWRYFYQFEREIRHEFQFVPDVKEKANEYLLSVRQKSRKSTVTYVGVHVRRTDYIPYLRRHGCITADAKYVRAAMRIMKNKYPDSLFILASDDINWCKEALSGSQYDIVFVNGERNRCSTMALLSLCNHSIVTQGSYGFWSAYLAGGEAIYLTNYCANKTRGLYKLSGMHLAHWLGISAS